MTARRPCLFGVASLLALVACGGESRAPPEPVLWSHPQVEPPDSDFHSSRLWLKDVSTWAAPGCGERQPTESRYMGDFGVGNGHVFALTGYACPLNTLHTMVGPDYQQESEFFRDSWLEVVADQHPDPPGTLSGHVFRVRRTAIVLTRERTPSWDLHTVTFAPLAASADDPLLRALVRIVVVRNTSGQPLTGVTLRTLDANVVRAGRRRTLAVLQPASASDPAAVSLGRIEAGAEGLAAFAYLTSVGGEGEDATLAALREAGFDALLESTRDAWFGWTAGAASLESPDPRVDDLLEGMLVTVRTQQTYLGGVSPMSRYTLMWIRDTAGAVRFFLRMGLFEDARAMLDYYHLAAILRGDISNALSLDYAPESPPPEPDWASMPPFEGRTEGETPSYLPLMARWYSRATGDDSLVDEQYEFFKRAVAAQNVSADGLIPFSGDETYRGAMSMTLGWDIEPDYVSCCKSANSSFLFVAASQALALEAEARGLAADAAALRERASLVRQATDEVYWTGTGYWAPFVETANPGELPPPFEDVSTKPLWTGFTGPDDEQARTNLANVMALLGREDGFLQSPLHERYDSYMEIDVHEGVYTGMMPGYYLTNLALVDHPEAPNAFNALGLAASPSGNFAEYQIYDDHSALQVIYDPGGTLGDLTARYRPWEGGVCLDGLVFFLTGLQPRSPAGQVALAPRLPNDWPRMQWRGLRVGGQRLDLLVEELGGERRVTVTPGAGALGVDLDVPLPLVSVEQVRVNDRTLKPGEYEVWGPFNLTRVRLGVLDASAAEPLRVSVRYGAVSR